MQPSIIVDNVSKVYRLYQSPKDRLIETLKLSRRKLHDDFFALNGVSFSVNPGETVGIIGKNGAGKSTLLKIVTGVLSPSGGTVQVNGRISALLELGAGFNPEYTGLENVYMNGTILGYSREEMDRRLPAILDFAEIGEFIHQPVKSYSSGMFMRLAFSVAINVEPEILIVDEALSVGDILFQAKCFKKIQEFRDSGRTILFVTHALSNVIQYCDRCIVMSHGEKLAEGDSADMVDLFKQVLAQSDDDREAIRRLVDLHRAQSEDAAAEAADRTGGMKGRLVTNRDFLEYGSKEIEIRDFAILDARGRITNLVEGEKPFRIVMRIHASAPVSKPIFAFTIKDLHGVELTGTNTMYNEIETGSVAVGENLEVTFTQSLPVPGSGYLLSLGCTGYRGDAFVVYHRLYDIAPIQVINERQMVGYFDPHSQITVKRMED